MGFRRKSKRKQQPVVVVGEAEDNGSIRVDRQDSKIEKKDNKYQYKVAKIGASAEKSKAVAEKRNALANLIKWFLIAMGAVWLFMKSGAFKVGDIFGSIKEKISGIFSK